MKKINWKNVIESIKTVTIVALIAGVIGFGLGVKHQESKNSQLEARISEQIQQLKDVK